jgi:deoxyribodipyrimidine photolyase-like uncharacterized protein
MAENKIAKLFTQELVVINMGLESFAEDLRSEGVNVLQMNWKPPAGGNKRLADLLARLGR